MILSLELVVRNVWVDSELDKTSREGLSPNSVSDNHLVGALGLRFTGLENTTLYAGWSQGYVFPTMINLGTGAFAGPDFVNPNPNLEPETSDSFELGAHYRNSNFIIDGSVFYTEAEDYIDFVSCSSVEVDCIEPAVGRRDKVYVNIDEVKSFGGELTLRYVQEEISPYMSLSWLRRRFESIGSKTYDTGIPELTGRTGVELEKEFSSTYSLWLDLFLRAATDSDELEDGELEHRAGWVTTNLALGLDLGEKRAYRFVLDLLNLGDKSYTTSTENIPARGRSAIVKVVVDI